MAVRFIAGEYQRKPTTCTSQQQTALD